MKRQPKISVIVPVYNSEKYLAATLETILNQNFQDFELLLIDDGSTDESGAICDEYEKKDRRIIVIHQENAGICAARNRGLQEAEGIYITFCDNDDIYLSGLLKDNYELAEQYNADVVRFSRCCMVYKNNQKISEEKTEFSDGVFSSDMFAENFDEINKAGEGVWAGMYRRDFLERHQIKFDEKMRFGYEDFHFITQIYLNSPTVVLNSKTYYCWIMRYEHSTSGKMNINNIESLLEGLVLKERMIDSLQIEQYFPDLWVSELARKIYSVVRYVSPVKIKMKLSERISILKYFRKGVVFERNISKNSMRMLYNKSKADWLVYVLFEKRLLLLLYFLVTMKQRMSEK